MNKKYLYILKTFTWKTCELNLVTVDVYLNSLNRIFSTYLKVSQKIRRIVHSYDDEKNILYVH